MLGTIACGLAALGVATAPQRVPAPPNEAISVRLEYRAPQECPSVDVLREQIGEGLGRTLLFDPLSEAQVSADITRTEQGLYALVLVTVVSGQTETRTLEAPHCAEVVDAAALVSALALEPFTAARSAAAIASVEPTAPAAAPAPDDRPDTALPSPPHATDPNPSPANPSPPNPSPLDVGPSPKPASAFAVFVDGAMGLALTTTVSGGVQGGIAWQRGRARIEASARHHLRRTTSGDPGADLALTAGVLQGCFVPRWGIVAFAACGGAAVGAIVADGHGTGVASARGRASWLGLVFSGGPRVALAPWLALRAGAELVAVPWRPTFHLRDRDEKRNVLSVSGVAGQFTLGLETRFNLK